MKVATTWNGFALGGISPDVQLLSESLPHDLRGDGCSYFWGKVSEVSGKMPLLPSHRGYAEARKLIGRGDVATLKKLRDAALSFVTDVFESIDAPDSASKKHIVSLRLSEDLLEWRKQQHQAGNILPEKGSGLKQVSKEILTILDASSWPGSLTTTSSLFGAGMMDFIIGAYDPATLFSNYVTDLGFYYEHGYDRVFPEMNLIIENALRDEHALRTAGGQVRREAVELGIQYIREKVALEEKHQANLTYRSARMDRKTMQTVSIYESSLVGLGTEAIFRGYDPASVMSDLIFSSPGTDVVDLGSDLINSEVMNSFLNTADIADSGVVTEDVLRRVYDAYAHTGARLLTERWSEPAARMCGALYMWHIINDRHFFLRRAILGYPKARKVPSQQREADMDEAFDEHLHTTGLSRPLKNACNGGDTCDKVKQFLEHGRDVALLTELWDDLVTRPLEYVRGGVIDAEREARMEEKLRVAVAKIYKAGLVLELVWLMSHANHHAWQVNYLFEAAMFGSILDNGKHAGKLDRAQD